MDLRPVPWGKPKSLEILPTNETHVARVSTFHDFLSFLASHNRDPEPARTFCNGTSSASSASLGLSALGSPPGGSRRSLAEVKTPRYRTSDHTFPTGSTNVSFYIPRAPSLSSETLTTIREPPHRSCQKHFQLTVLNIQLGNVIPLVVPGMVPRFISPELPIDSRSRESRFPESLR